MSEASQPAIQPAPETPEQLPTYAAKFYARSPQGFVVEISADQLTRPMAWLTAMTESLGKIHFEPIDPYRPAEVDVDVNAPVAPQGAAGVTQSGEAVEIPGENGAPPRCSLHGAMEWKEGTSQSGQNAGKRYAFWACKVRNCRPKKQQAA